MYQRKKKHRLRSKLLRMLVLCIPLAMVLAMVTQTASAKTYVITDGSRGATLTATARCRKDGRTTGVYNVGVVDDLGRDIAQAVVTGYKLKT